MSSSIRVFLVDDTAVVRRIVSQILEEEPDIEVVGTAANGMEALQRIPRVMPDIVVLDLEMPGMGGLEMLRQMRRGGLDLPVLVFSSVTERGAMVTVEALLLGANDYVTKPSMLGSIEAARSHVRAVLLPRVRSLCGRAAPQVMPVTPLQEKLPAPADTGLVDAVVIAVSTGGPNALADVVPALPEELPVPVFIVQHMPPMFTRALAERLAKLSALPVRECSQLATVMPGEVWIAAGGYHMVVERDDNGLVVRPDLSEPENFCRPAADVLFRSVVRVYGRRVLAIVMTGMGQDGGEGSRAVRHAGGQVLVQDEASSVVWGMPGYVVEAGLACQVVGLHELAGEIWRRVRVGRPWLPEAAARKRGEERALS